jgi:ATP-binding cassette subfamily F protein uup
MAPAPRGAIFFFFDELLRGISFGHQGKSGNRVGGDFRLDLIVRLMLLTARNIEKSHGPRLLFAGITLGIDQGQRIGLIGANGSGKSTLLRIFAGQESPDAGEISTARLLRVGYVAQRDEFDAGATCRQIVADAMDSHLDVHEREVRAEMALGRAGFSDVNAPAGSLSGGWRKRLAIVRSLAADPQLLLLDEPTNHLDIEGIVWLEQAISASSFATLLVSHDRRFLENVANRIIELSRSYPDGFLSHSGKYSEFLVKREEFLASQQGRQQALASTVRREIEWLQRGAKARTTKAKGRIERAQQMMSDLSDLKARNAAQGAVGVEFSASDRKTRKLIQAKHVAKDLGGRRLFADVNFTFSPGHALGLLGPNGSGKSTLIRLLAGEIEPDAGSIFRADGLRIVVFDQHREPLDPTQTLRRALAPSGDTVKFHGNTQHVSGWAQRFLFRIEQLDLPVGELSGGEQARVLIARLMLREADVLILDEPTNDLDIATLDVLESNLEDFDGAVVLVTHDRYLLERLSSELLALDGKGAARMFASLSQWELAQEEEAERGRAAARSQIEARAPATARTGPKPAAKRLKWNEQRELDGMEAAIAAAEAKVTELQKQVADPHVMRDRAKMHEACTLLGNAQQEVERLYARWSELESMLA